MKNPKELFEAIVNLASKALEPTEEKEVVTLSEEKVVESIEVIEKEVVLAKENAKLKKEQELFVARQQQESLRQQARARSIQGIANTGLQALSLFESLSSQD